VGDMVMKYNTVTTEPDRKPRRQQRSEPFQQLESRRIALRQGRKHLVAARFKQVLPLFQLLRVLVIELNQLLRRAGDQPHGHAVRTGLERQMDRFGRQLHVPAKAARQNSSNSICAPTWAVVVVASYCGATSTTSP